MSEQEMIALAVETAVSSTTQNPTGTSIGTMATGGIQALLFALFTAIRGIIKELKDDISEIRVAVAALQESQGDGVTAIVPLLEDVIQQGKSQHKFNRWTTGVLKMIFARQPGADNHLLGPAPGGGSNDDFIL